MQNGLEISYLNMVEKINIHKRITSSVFKELEAFIGKQLKFIRGSYLYFSLHDQDKISTKDYCVLEFSEQKHIYILELSPHTIWNKYFDNFAALDLKVISMKRLEAKGAHNDNLKDFYSSIFDRPGYSVINCQGDQELVLEQMIFLGYREVTTEITHLSGVPEEKEIDADLVEGVLLRFSSNTEILIRSREDHSLEIQIFRGIDERRAHRFMNHLEWKSKEMFRVKR